MWYLPDGIANIISMHELESLYRITYDSWKGYYVVHTPKGEVRFYKDEQGHTAVLDCVKKAEKLRLDHEDSKTYIGMAGDLSFNAHIEKLAFGPHKVLLEGRTTTAHTPGGTGALRVAAEFIKKANPDATIWVTSPTWANHI